MSGEQLQYITAAQVVVKWALVSIKCVVRPLRGAVSASVIFSHRSK
jgi:hypothetical protein